MFQRLSTALALVLATASPLFAQHPPLSFCLVQTKPDARAQYDPPAGPWATELFNLLSTRKLKSGAPLKIMVLPALNEEDVLPAVHRLHCLYAIQLLYHGSFWHEGRTRGDDQDSLLFFLRNGATGKAIADGASIISGRDHLPSTSLKATCADLAQQIMKSLNQLP